MKPIWLLLMSKENSSVWNASLRGSLKSVVTNRQWPQARCFCTSWSTHSSCLFCLPNTIVADGFCPTPPPIGTPHADYINAALNTATSEQIPRTPIGNLHHRTWSCPTHESLRVHYAPPSLLVEARDGGGIGQPFFGRALAPATPVVVPQRSSGRLSFG